LVLVAKDDTGEADHDLDEFEVEIGISSKAALEVVAEGGDAGDSAGRIVEELGGDGRGRDDVGIVVRKDGVEGMGGPSGDPVVGKFCGFGFGEHGTYCVTNREVQLTRYRRVIDFGRGEERANLRLRRKSAGGEENWRLKARLNAASEE